MTQVYKIRANHAVDSQTDSDDSVNDDFTMSELVDEWNLSVANEQSLSNQSQDW